MSTYSHFTAYVVVVLLQNVNDFVCFVHFE